MQMSRASARAPRQGEAGLKRRFKAWLKRGWWSACVLCLGVSGSACRDDNPAFFISGNIIGVPAETGCTFDPDGEVLLSGLFDKRFYDALKDDFFFSQEVRGYEAVLAVESALVALNSENATTSTGIFMETAEVWLQDEADQLLPLDGNPNPFTVAVNGFINAGSESARATQSVKVSVIPPEYGQLVPDGPIVARVRILGRTQGGTKVESAYFRYRILVCDDLCTVGCLSDPTLDPVLSCLPGQDFGSSVRRIMQNGEDLCR